MSKQILRANALAAWCWYMCERQGGQQDEMDAVCSKMFKDVVLVWLEIFGSFCLGEAEQAGHVFFFSEFDLT